MIKSTQSSMNVSDERWDTIMNPRKVVTRAAIIYIVVFIVALSLVVWLSGCSDPVTPENKVAPPIVDSELAGSWICYASTTHWFTIEIQPDLTGVFSKYQSPVLYKFTATHDSKFAFETESIDGLYYSFEGLAGLTITGELRKHIEKDIYSYWQTEWRRY